MTLPSGPDRRGAAGGDPEPTRYFEDFIPGAVHDAGCVSVSAEETVEFARRYDPQPFHVDADAARASTFGGLIASGWHTGPCNVRARLL